VGSSATGYPVTKDSSFSCEYTVVTKDEQAVLDYNGSYFLVFGNYASSSSGKNGNIMATISDFGITVEELP
jgi:hypothetical protein